MHGSGWVQNFGMLHLLHAFSVWDSIVYCAKLGARCAHHFVGAEARADYQTRQISQCRGGGRGLIVHSQFVPHPNTDFSINML